ncbi:glycosyl transferase [Limnohabitans sp. MMS-10A-160]|uniref:glycosyltransferase n=1 Tax=unclassified Limnohabitans TaxID=2626134 RepID=UPI000D3B325B|nr:MULTISPECIES: glycosyltransferase [unclassified Limnohabitans]PUE18973.1 glycosyl transferase [Limnohabitans sp. MMS-10A-192]PUE24421.1 glycosyl transferase [Limnohabitans sp. MMS-10A-160]
MHILFINRAVIPVFAYSGTERVIWDLGLALVKMGHRVSYLVPSGSQCPFGQVIEIQEELDWQSQIPVDVDVVHFQFNPGLELTLDRPWLMTQHGNSQVGEVLPANTVFVSRDHAQRHNARCHVHNGLDWSAYGPVELSKPDDYFHFLGKAAWRVKNVQGAIDTCLQAPANLVVMGGNRLNLKRGFRFTWSRKIQFKGMVGGETKFSVMRRSKGLVFPVRWHEPFGLAVIESLYFGCPVFATPYGALQELVPAACGVLSNHQSDLAAALTEQLFDRETCHLHARENFNAEKMAQGYLHVYSSLLSGAPLNETQPCMIEPASPLPWLKNSHR